MPDGTRTLDIVQQPNRNMKNMPQDNLSHQYDKKRDCKIQLKSIKYSKIPTNMLTHEKLRACDVHKNTRLRWIINEYGKQSEVKVRIPHDRYSNESTSVNIIANIDAVCDSVELTKTHREQKLRHK